MSPDQGPGKKPPEDLDAFGEKLSKARKSEEAVRLWKSNAEKPSKSALGLASRVGIELISALAVGFAIGWGIDQLIDTTPWFMVVFIILGFAAGVINVYRIAAGFGSAVGYEKRNEASTAESPMQGPTNKGKD